MIQVILKDRLNPLRAESIVYENTDSAKVSAFIQGMKRGLLYDHWEIKTKIGGTVHDNINCNSDSSNDMDNSFM